MKYVVDKQEEYVVLTPQDERINTLNAPDLKSELVLLYNNGFHNIILDLSHVHTIDSSGLSAFLMTRRLTNSSNGVFTLCQVGPHVRKLLEISQLDKTLNVLPTLKEAIEDLHMHQLQAELGGSADGQQPNPIVRDGETRLANDPGLA